MAKGRSAKYWLAALVNSVFVPFTDAAWAAPRLLVIALVVGGAVLGVWVGVPEARPRLLAAWVALPIGLLFLFFQLCFLRAFFEPRSWWMTR